MAILPSKAHAYLDPGTGSLIIQGVIAALAAVGYGMRLYWSRIRLWFKRSNSEGDSAEIPPPFEKP